jgi:hypothetical protein
MKDVQVESVDLSGTDRKGNAVFVAEGALDGKAFVAQTIQYKGEPIFKLQEGGSHKGLDGSQFGRGDRIAVARACKAARVEKFGEGHKERVEPDLKTGEIVTIAASVSKDADTASDDELIAADEILQKARKTEMHPSGLPMHASISALKRAGY